MGGSAPAFHRRSIDTHTHTHTHTNTPLLQNFAFMPFRDRTFTTLNQILSVSMLPTLVIVNRSNGKVITHWGRTCVEKNPDHCVEEWKNGRAGVSWLQTLCTIS